MSNIKTLNQYFTPAWAAELLFDRHFGHLTNKDLVWEPTCGIGNCLAAIPNHIPAFGSELDEALIIQAQKRTGRHVLYGDCISVQLPSGITAIFGNPPFNLKVFEGLLYRSSNILIPGNKAGFIVPAYFLSTSNTALRLSNKWAVSQELLPGIYSRNFPFH